MSEILLMLASLAMNCQVIWTNTTIDIPLGADEHEYFDLPIARIIDENGKEVIDEGMYFQKGVNGTYLSVVKSNHVKDFRITYRVIFPNNRSYNQTATITFRIVDEIPPKIHHTPEHRYLVGTKKIDYLEGLLFSDNYYENDKCIVEVKGEVGVNLTQIGAYKIEYTIIDGSKNVTTHVMNVVIFDNITPIIKQKKALVIEVHSMLVLDNFFTISDNYDTYVKTTIDDQKVNYDIKGTYKITIIATDSSGNMNTLETEISIVDTTPPELILVTGTLDITVYEGDVEGKLRSAVLSFGDNYDDISAADISISYNVDSSKIGKYEAVYILFDTSKNKVQKTLKIEVVDNVSPTISPKKELTTIRVLTEIPNVYELFEISDNYDEYHDLNISLKNNVNLATVGKYYLEVSVEDRAKNKARLFVDVMVIDDLPPELLTEEVLITDYSAPDYEKILLIEDNYDLYPQMRIDDANVIYDSVGEYFVKVLLNDGDNNQKVHILKVKIIDIIPPILELSWETITISLGQTLDIMKNILSVMDDHDELDIIDVQLFETVDFDIVGKYEITYHVSDKSQNHNIMKCIILVDDLISPHIISEPLVIKIGDDLINWYEGISAVDNYDGDLTNQIVLLENPDMKTAGKKYATYQASDKRGNVSIHYREVIVIGKTIFHYDRALLLIAVALSVCGYIFYRYYRAKNFDKRQQINYN